MISHSIPFCLPEAHEDFPIFDFNRSTFSHSVLATQHLANANLEYLRLSAQGVVCGIFSQCRRTFN